MVMRKKTGWEDFKLDPVAFVEKILLLQLSHSQAEILDSLVDGSRGRVGLVLRDDQLRADAGCIDGATFAVAIALWSAATSHRTTLLWGGRRSTNQLWLKHATEILTAARPEFVRGHRFVTGDGTSTCGLKMPNGAWAMRYDGPFLEDAVRAIDEHAGHVEILVGDFDWIDKDMLAEAYACERDGDSLLTLVTLGRDR